MLIAALIFGPIAAGPLVYLLGRRREEWRDAAAALVTGAELVLARILLGGQLDAVRYALTIPDVLLSGLSFRSDGFRAVYVGIAALMWFCTTLFSREYFRHEREGLNAYWLFILVTLGCTQGVMLSADFMTAFVFFEILSLTSFTWVIHERTGESIHAAYTYLFVAVIGGLILLMGLLLLHRACGTLVYAYLPAALAGADRATAFAAGACILLGFGAKAGMFPLHVWLPRAHPVAPAPASALLSGILTKVGVFGILMITLLYQNRAFGLLVLCLGLVTMALGAVLALFSVNLKRTLACSSMSQIGFILTGLGVMLLSGAYGEGTGELLALSGAVLHMVNHSLLKLVLFLAAGAVAMNLHALDLNDIRGWGRNKNALHTAFLLGVLGISGVPGLNGYLSKTLLHEGIVHLTQAAGSGRLALCLRGAEWLFLFSGGLTFAYMLKLYLCIFWEKNQDPGRQARFDRDSRCMNPLSAAVLLGSALLLVPLGQTGVVVPLARTMTGAALTRFSAFSWESLRGALISLSIGGAVYLLFVRPVLRPGGSYVNLWSEAVDLEERVYRPLLLRGLPGLFGRLAQALGDNVFLRPLFRFLVFVLSVIGRALDSSMDALAVLLRRTALREERVRDGRHLLHAGRWKVLGRATEEAFSPVVGNFSFALVTTCAGILLILGFLVLFL